MTDVLETNRVEAIPVVLGEGHDFPMAILKPRCEVDKYNNPVSLIEWVDRTYRVVHYNDARSRVQRGTIFAGRGVSIQFREYYSNSDIAENNSRVGPFIIAWGDGDNLGVHYKPSKDAEEQRSGTEHDCFLRQAENIQDDNYHRFMVEAVLYIDKHNLWDRK